LFVNLDAEKKLETHSLLSEFTGAKYMFTVPEFLSKAQATGLPVGLIEGDAPGSFLHYSDLLTGDPKNTPRLDIHGITLHILHFFSWYLCTCIIMLNLIRHSLICCSVQVNQEDPVAVLFSSGTTGESKGVVLTHRNMIAVCGVLRSPRVDGGLNGICLQLIPMFHVFGLMVGVCNLARGSKVVVLPRFDFIEMLSTIEKYKVTAFPLVPPILLLMIKQDVVRKYDMTSLRNIGCGAAPLGKEQLEQCAIRFPNAKLIQVILSMLKFSYIQVHSDDPEHRWERIFRLCGINLSCDITFS
jgi:hypothetical protein